MVTSAGTSATTTGAASTRASPMPDARPRPRPTPPTSPYSRRPSRPAHPRKQRSRFASPQAHQLQGAGEAADLALELLLVLEGDDLGCAGRAEDPPAGRTL